MVTIDLTQDELDRIINMIEGSSVQMAHAEKALALYKKFKDAE